VPQLEKSDALGDDQYGVADRHDGLPLAASGDESVVLRSEVGVASATAGMCHVPRDRQNVGRGAGRYARCRGGHAARRDDGAAGRCKADQAGRALDEIRTAVARSVLQVTQIATSSRAMAGDAGEVTRPMQISAGSSPRIPRRPRRWPSQVTHVSSAVRDIASVAEDQSATSAQLSASTEQISAQVEHMSSQAEELAATAAELRSLVSRFTVASDAPPSKIVALCRAA
jgi:hypothetical protein